MSLPRFYPIFDTADWIARAVPLGVKLVQLRVKDRSEAETRAEIIRARDLCRDAGATLVVNDYWRIAIDEVIGRKVPDDITAGILDQRIVAGRDKASH